MRFFSVSFWLELKDKLCSRWFVIFLLLLGLLLGGLKIYQKNETTPIVISAGIAYDKNDPFADAVFQTLSQLAIIEFTPLIDYSDEQLIELVQNRSFETIYRFPPTLKESIIKGDFQEAVPSFLSPNNQFSNFIDKWVFIAILVQATPDISSYEVSKALDLPLEQITPDITQRISWFQNNYHFVETISQWQEDATAPTTNTLSISTLRIAHGIVAIILTMYSIVCFYSQISSKNQVFPRLHRQQRLLFTGGSFLSVWMSLFLLGICSILLLTLLELSGRPIFVELFSCFLFCFILTSFSTLLAQIFSSTEAIFSGTIFLFLLLLVFGSVLFDPKEISPLLYQISRIFPTSYYTDALVYGNLKLLKLPVFFSIGMTGITFGCASVVHQRRK